MNDPPGVAPLTIPAAELGRTASGRASSLATGAVAPTARSGRLVEAPGSHLDLLCRGRRGLPVAGRLTGPSGQPHFGRSVFVKIFCIGIVILCLAILTQY